MFSSRTFTRSQSSHGRCVSPLYKARLVMHRNDADHSSQFAIRPNLRNHNVLTRNTIITGIASLVGPPHKVDLKNYELLIMVEVYQVSWHTGSNVSCR